jgi:hypothetical protein
MSYIDLTLTGAPSIPALNHVEIFGDSADGFLKYINSSGTIALISLPQSVAVTAAPTFVSETLSYTTNQLILGTTNTTTISATAPISSQVITIPDPGASATFILSKGSPTMGTSLAMDSNKITGLANGTASADAVAFGQLLYAGITQGIQPEDFSTSSSSFVVITGLTVTLTPKSSSSRFKISTSFLMYGSAPGNEVQVDFYRNGSRLTNLYDNTGSEGVIAFTRVNGIYLDAPSTGSSITYDVRIAISSGATISIGNGCPGTLIVEEFYS